MKNMFKYAYSALVAAAALTAVSCSDKYEYDGKGDWNANADYANIYFQDVDNSVELDPADPTSLQLAVYRHVGHNYTWGTNDDGEPEVVSDEITTPLPAITVKLDVLENTDNIYTVGEASFAQGDTVGYFTVDFPNAEIGKPYRLQLTTSDPSLVSQYSSDIIYTLDVTRVKWNNVGFYIDDNGNQVDGYAIYREDFLSTFWGVSNIEFPIVIQERDDMPGYFRLKNVYCEDYPYNDPGDWDDSKDYYIYIDATNPDQVYIPHYSETGLNWGYGIVSMSSLAGLRISQGRAAEAAEYYGTYENGQITFPAGALLISMSDYNSGGWYGSNNSGQFAVIIDPTLNPYTAEVEDYDWEEVFTGVYTSNQLGKVNEGVTLYKGVKIPEVEEANEGCYDRFEELYGTVYRIASPYADGYDLYFGVKDGEVVVIDGYESQPLGIDAAGNAVYGVIGAGGSTFSDIEIALKLTFQNKSGSIEFGSAVETLANITYTVVGTGDFTYVAFEDEPYVQEGLELSVRDDKPEIYKISNWYEDIAGLDFFFTWNKKTNEVEVLDQYIGYTHPSYGEVNVVEASIYNPNNAAFQIPSYFDPETNTFHFGVVYYVSAGYFGVGYDEFVVDFNAATRVGKVQRAGGKHAFDFSKLNTSVKPVSRFSPKAVDNKKVKPAFKLK